MRATLLLVCLGVVGCGADALPATAFPIAVLSATGAVTATIHSGSPDGCLLHHPSSGETVLDMAASSSGASVYLSVEGANVRAGGAYTSMLGPDAQRSAGAQPATVVLELTDGGRLWVGDEGSVTLTTASATLITGSITATLRPSNQAAVGGNPVQLAGSWSCQPSLRSPPSPLL